MTADADFGVTKDGVLYGLVTNVDKNGIDVGPAVGDLFRLRIKTDKDLLTVSEVKDGGARVKEVFEGAYQRRKD